MSHAEDTITATFRGKTFVFPFSSLSIEVQKGLYEEMMMTDKQREERDKKPVEERDKKMMTDKIGELLTRLLVLKEEKPETYKLLNERFYKENERFCKENERFCKEFEETPVPVKDDKEENKKAMKNYVKARLNHLMGLGQKQMMDDGGDGAVECLLTRREEWDGEAFDNIICSLCNKRDGELNASKSGYEFSVLSEITEKDDNVWEVSVSWSVLEQQNPFDDFYDEDEDNGSDSDDE